MGRGPRGYREPRPPRMFPRYRPFPDSTRSKEARHDFLALESTACAGRGVARVGVRRQRWWWRHGALHPGSGDATRQEWWGRSVLVRQQPASDTSQRDRARRQQLSAVVATPAALVVNWAVGSGGGGVNPAQSTTSAAGVATTADSVGATSPQTVTATFTGLAAPVTFTAT